METLRILSSGEHSLSPRTELVSRNGRLLARKSYPARNPLAIALLNHEAAILSVLQGIEGIPGLVDFKPNRHILIEFVEGRTIDRSDPDRLMPGVFDRLERIVADMHRRRVAHLDLRQRKNILVSPDGEPTIIDFQSSIHFPGNGIFDPIFSVCRWTDRSALVRWKNRFFPSLMTEADRSAIRFHMWIRPLWVFSPFKKRRMDLA